MCSTNEALKQKLENLQDQIHQLIQHVGSNNDIPDAVIGGAVNMVEKAEEKIGHIKKIIQKSDE